MCWEKSKSRNKKEAVKKTEVHSTEADVGFAFVFSGSSFFGGESSTGFGKYMVRGCILQSIHKRNPNPKLVW